MNTTPSSADDKVITSPTSKADDSQATVPCDWKINLTSNRHRPHQMPPPGTLVPTKIGINTFYYRTSGTLQEDLDAIARVCKEHNNQVFKYPEESPDWIQNELMELFPDPFAVEDFIIQHSPLYQN